MNLIQDAKSGGGLMGTMSGLTATPDFELGFFTSDDNSKVYPKVIDLSCTFYPLHEHLLGWFGPFFNQTNYPYSAAGKGLNFVDTLGIANFIINHYIFCHKAIIITVNFAR